MELKWFIYFVMFIGANIVESQAKNLHSFRCLLEDTFEPCIVFPETSLNNVTVFSYKLINEYANLSADIHNAIELQNLSLISEETLVKIPDAILFLLPVNHLSSINQKYLMNLIIERSRSLVVKHLVKAYLLGNGDEYFNEKTVDLPVESLTWIADAVSSDVNGAKGIINHPPLLFYSPPFSLLFNNTSQKLFYLSLWERSNNISKEINKAYLRFWAYATIKNSFPGPLNHWNDLCLERWGTLLTASTSDELKLLNRSNIDNLQLLFSFRFSTIQVRTIFEGFAEQLMNSRLDYFTLSNLFIDLLPEQLLLFPKIIPYIEQLKVLPSIKSIPTSKQIFEILMFEKGMAGKDGVGYINNFSYVLPLQTLSEAFKHPLSLSSLIKIQSSHFTKSQLFILSSRSRVFDFDSEYIFECKDLIKVLPARDIIFNQTASHVLLHLLSVVSAENLPQSFSVLNKLWNLFGSSDVFKKILANSDCDVLLDYIPSRFIAKFVNSILITIDENINSYKQLPDTFVSSLLVSLSETEKNVSLLNIKESLEFLFNGISCYDVSLLDPYDFVVFMAKYIEQRKISGKDFPKALQQCCLDKFFAYIQLKSSLFQGILGESKLSLLNEAEIDSIGGYIFSALPIKPVAKAKYSKRIIKSIGELSLSELIMAAPISKLQEFGAVLIHNSFIAGKKIDFTLFDLGNLTLFLDKKYITEINETYFRLLLESSFIDHRVCINKSSRLAWFNLLKQCFGETNTWTYQTLVTLGDLLIVVPDEELDKIPSNSWKYAADVLISHYNDIIKYYSSSLKFYEVCMLQLKPDESQEYFNDLKILVKVLADAAQLQLNTVTTVQEFQEKKKNSNDGVFTFINSRKSNIKISLPSIQNVINTEKPEKKNETELKVTESLNKDEMVSYSAVRNESFFISTFSNMYTIDLKNVTEETTAHSIGSTNETPHYTFNQNGTSEEIKGKTDPVSELTIFKFNNTNEVKMPSSEEFSTFFNMSEKHFHLTTPLDDLTPTTFSNSTITDGESSSSYVDLENNRYYFTAKNDTTHSSTSFFNNGLSTPVVEISSKIHNNEYSFHSSGFEIDYSSSLPESHSLSTPSNTSSVDLSINDVTKPLHSEELVTDSSNHISTMSSTPISTTFHRIIHTESKVTDQLQLDSLLKNNNVTTEFIKLNFSSLKLRKNNSGIIGNTRIERVENNSYYFTTKNNTTKSSISSFNNGFSTPAIEISSKTHNNEYSFEIDYSNSLPESHSWATPTNISTVDLSMNDVTKPIHSEELITDSSDHISTMSSTSVSTALHRKIHNEFKVTDELQLDNLLKNKNVTTEFMKLNFSSFKLRKNNSGIIGNARRERVKRSIGQYSCEALKMVGKLAEIIVSEEIIQTMPLEDLNECADLFSEMDLPVNVKSLIWSKLKLDRIFMYGKLVSAISSSDVKNINFSLSAPWVLETISLIGRYSNDPEVEEHVIKSISSTRKLQYTLEILVTLGSLICKLPVISSELIEPPELLKASVILGRNLPCNYPCLQKLSNIAIKDGAFGDPSKWNAKDISDLGIIVAGLERIHWKKLLHSRKKPLRGLSEQAFKCLSQDYIEELELQYNMNFSKIYLKGPNLFSRSIDFDFFGATNDSFAFSNEYISHSILLTSFYLGFHLQILIIVIITILNHY